VHDGTGAGTRTRDALPAITTRQLFLWAAIAVLGIDFVFLTGASNFGASVQARILNQVLMLAVAVGLGIAARRGAAVVRSPLLLPGLAFVVASLIAAVFSTRAATSREAVALLLLSVPAYILIRAVTWTDWLRPRLDRLIVGATLVFLLAYLVQAVLEWVRWWSVAWPAAPPLRPGDVGLTIGTVNAIALYLELLVPVAVAIAWSTLRRRWLGGAIAVCGAIALVVTASRGAWLGVAVAAIVGSVLAWLQAGRPVPRGNRRTNVALVAIAIVVVAAAILLGPALSSRLLAGDTGRIELWTAAWSMFQSSPVTGTGPGTFPMLRALSPITDPNLAVVTTSHNSVLQVLTDAGLLGFAAAVAIVLGVATLVWRSRRDPERVPPAQWLAISVTLVAVLVHSIVDTQFHIPGVMVLLFVLVARLDAPARVTTAVHVARPTRATALAAVAVFAGALVLAPIDVAMVRGALGNSALARGDPATALNEFRAAVALQDIAPYSWGEGLAASYLGDDGMAASAFARAAALHPLTFHEANAAGALPPAERAPFIGMIEAAGPYDPAATVNVAAWRYPTDPGTATRELASVMEWVPSLIHSTRPPELFDDAVWAAAQLSALDSIGPGNPALACASATIAQLADPKAAWCSKVAVPELVQALAWIDEATTGGATDIPAARALLRQDPGSPVLQSLLWILAFQVKEQVLANDVAAVAVPEYATTPEPFMELVVDGRVNADWAWRIGRYPMASDFRNGPARQYGDGMITIEPVYRPAP
jgi:putative inorganic carbon (HCO3(-)) transporter